MKTRRNLLVQYKGGGYDGCYWEWNFFLFDGRGRFHNLMSTGHRGIQTAEQAKALLDCKPSKIFPYTYTLREELYRYNLKSKSSLKEFRVETSNKLVDKIGTLVNTLYKKEVISFKCFDCSNLVFLNSTNSGYPRMFHADSDYKCEEAYCEDCYFSHSCGYCGTFNSVEENNVDDEGHCSYCSPY